ncbi:hypothetical protein [Streptomyces atratus]|uniref:hypothetical protein n=1 Tax=Streptomyces atratus TaxID=1893 RepID=UPI00366149A1
MGQVTHVVEESAIPKSQQAEGGRRLALNSASACGKLQQPWHTIKCDYVAGHPDDCNSTSETAVVLAQVNRLKRLHGERPGLTGWGKR